MSATLDAKGLRCPLPVLRARKALAALAPGEVLTVLATDPGAAADFDAFCESAGHALEERSEDRGVLTFRIRKAG